MVTKEERNNFIFGICNLSMMLASDRMNMGTENDLYYIRLILKGEVEQFIHLLRRYDKMVFTTINKIVKQREISEDITQEVFVKVFQNLSKFREDSEFSTWIYRIAYNTTISELRKKKYKKSNFNIDYNNIVDIDINNAIENVDIEDQLKYLDQVLGSMPQEDALLITMFYLNELTVKQISQITDYTESNIKVKLHRIRKYMNQEINKLIKDE